MTVIIVRRQSKGEKGHKPFHAARKMDPERYGLRGLKLENFVHITGI